MTRDPVVQDESDEQLLDIRLGDVELGGDERDADTSVGLDQLQEDLGECKRGETHSIVRPFN